MFDLRKNLVACSTYIIRRSLVACSTLEGIWSGVQPQKEFGRVLDLRRSLVVCSTLEGVRSHVRP